MRKKTDNFQLIKFFPDLVFIRLAPGHSWGQELGGLGWGWAEASQNSLYQFINLQKYQFIYAFMIVIGDTDSCTCIFCITP